MFAFKQPMIHLGVRIGLFAGTSAAVHAIAGMGAGGATAAPACPNKLEFHGKGSTLQKAAQEVWTVSYNLACANAPKVSYEPTGSGPALEAFGFINAPLKVNNAIQFIGTDDAPNAAQIVAAEGLAGTKPIVVPVSQTAIAVMINPPANCQFKAKKGITWNDLSKAFGGNGITKWEQFTNIEATVAGACNAPVKRVVRKEGSGTTYQFKNYLSTLEKAPILAEAPPCAAAKWSELKEIGAEEKPNITWPECLGGTKVITAAGGGALAAKVVATEGAIGYAALPDAKANGAMLALMQDAAPAGEPMYGAAGKEEVVGGVVRKTARCGTLRYTVPAGGQRGPGGTGEAVDWSEVFGAKPRAGGGEYPLCTLTYDIGWKNYLAAGYGANAGGWGEDVGDYIRNYVVPPAEGQTAIVGSWYSPLPAVVGAATNVQEAAEFAAEKLP